MMVINQQMHTIIKNIQANYCLRLGFAALKFEVQSITARCVGVGGSGRQSHTEYVAQNQRFDYIRMQNHTAYARAASPHTLFSIFHFFCQDGPGHWFDMIWLQNYAGKVGVEGYITPIPKIIGIPFFFWAGVVSFTIHG